MEGLNISNIGITLILMNFVISFLPESPFNAFIANLSNLPYLNVLNWFLPVSEMLAILQVWLFTITTYYIISMAARWIKIIK